MRTLTLLLLLIIAVTLAALGPNPRDSHSVDPRCTEMAINPDPFLVKPAPPEPDVLTIKEK